MGRTNRTRFAFWVEIIYTPFILIREIFFHLNGIF